MFDAECVCMCTTLHTYDVIFRCRPNNHAHLFKFYACLRRVWSNSIGLTHKAAAHVVWCGYIIFLVGTQSIHTYSYACTYVFCVCYVRHNEEESRSVIRFYRCRLVCATTFISLIFGSFSTTKFRRRNNGQWTRNHRMCVRKFDACLCVCVFVIDYSGGRRRPAASLDTTPPLDRIISSRNVIPQCTQTLNVQTTHMMSWIFFVLSMHTHNRQRLASRAFVIKCRYTRTAVGEHRSVSHTHTQYEKYRFCPCRVLTCAFVDSYVFMHLESRICFFFVSCACVRSQSA